MVEVDPEAASPILVGKPSLCFHFVKCSPTIDLCGVALCVCSSCMQQNVAQLMGSLLPHLELKGVDPADISSIPEEVGCLCVCVCVCFLFVCLCVCV